MYRVHTVKKTHGDPLRVWDECQFGNFPEALAAFNRCEPHNPTIHTDLIPDDEYYEALPLEVFLTFSNATYRYHNIEKGIGVIRHKIVERYESQGKSIYLGAI